MIRLIILIFPLVRTWTLFSQTDTVIEFNLKYKFPKKECRYRSSPKEGDVSGNCKYWIGKRKVTQEQYDDYLLHPDPRSKCKPCYLINKVKGKTVYEGEFYQDCGIGVFIEWYKNGKMKIKGQYKSLVETDIKEFTLAGKCNTRDGEWFYYKKNGELDKKVLYRNGVEIN